MASWTARQAQNRFARLDAWLLEHRYLWQPQPFTYLVLPWEEQHQQLARWLRGRSLLQAEQDHVHPWQVDAPPPFAELARQAQQLASVPELHKQQVRLPARLGVNVPGRKWQQLQEFIASMDFFGQPQRWLDWCGGKGYLARHLAYPQQRVDCLELQQKLCQDGARECRELGLEVSFHQLDAFSSGAQQLLAQADACVALHACGDLHTSLLRHAVCARTALLAVSPCCYNRIGGAGYQPLSAPARCSALHLQREDLALVMQASVTASSRDRRLRDHSMAWRLAFDLLQRRARGVNQYLTVPSVASKWLQLDFAHWCQRVAELKQVVLPAQVDWPQLEAAGWQRLAQVRNLELLQGLFRRPMEIWLLLDQVMFLQEHGYQVNMGSFCQPGLTPRNLAVMARRTTV